MPLKSLWNRLRAALGFAPATPPVASYRYLARTIERQFPCGAGGVALAVSCPDDDAFGAEVVLRQAEALQVELQCKVLVIDARAPGGAAGLTQKLNLEQRPGCAELLLDPERPIDAFVQPAGAAAVPFLPQGAQMPSVVAVQRPAVDRLLAQARARFDYTLVQVGAVTQDTRHLVVASRADAVLLLAREHATPMALLEACQEVLARDGVPEAHVVLART